ncbi:hypothetical protein SNF32_01020 [Enterococcus mundtii]|nr:hypothetical protein [Enterococcus mundtii]
MNEQAKSIGKSFGKVNSLQQMLRQSSGVGKGHRWQMNWRT